MHDSIFSYHVNRDGVYSFWGGVLNKTSEYRKENFFMWHFISTNLDSYCQEHRVKNPHHFGAQFSDKECVLKS